MKNFERWFFLILLVLTMGGVTGSVYYGKNTQLRKDIDSHIAHLKAFKASLEASLADMTEAQKELAGAKGKVLTFDEVKSIRARIDKDQADIQTYTSEILGDINFLQGQWSDLTQEEKDLVTAARAVLS